MRYDRGSQYMSEDYQAELRFLGVNSSPAFVRQLEGNGCVERFIRTLQEQLLYVRTFRTVEELRQALAEFRERYNQCWIVQRRSVPIFRVTDGWISVAFRDWVCYRPLRLDVQPYTRFATAEKPIRPVSCELIRTSGRKTS